MSESGPRHPHGGLLAAQPWPEFGDEEVHEPVRIGPRVLQHDVIEARVGERLDRKSVV